MNLLALTDLIVAGVVILGTLWALGLLFCLGLGRASALADEEIEAYIAEELARLYVDAHGRMVVDGPYDEAARAWIAERRAS